MSFLCLALTSSTQNGAFEQYDQYRDQVDMVELRADFLGKNELNVLSEFPKRIDKPLIFTIRRKCDKGSFAGDDSERMKLLDIASKAGFQYIDLESDVTHPLFEQQCRKRGVRIIRSFHDFTGVPENLSRIIRDLPRHPSELPKVAVMPKSTAEVKLLLRAFRETEGVEKILLGMGSYGFFTRILAEKLGSWCSFCSAADIEAAPGHTDPGTLKNVYRFSSITKNTRLFGIIANPVMHSRSPWIHNAAYESQSLNAVYVPFLVDDIDLFFSYADQLDVQGLSVSVPHKTAVRSVAVQEEEAVSATGACNTLVRTSAGWAGKNTDVFGFLAPLMRLLGADSLSRRRAVVVGAGGTARTAVYALKKAGAEVYLINRTLEKAKLLGHEFGCRWGALNISATEELRQADFIIQTTSCGMFPNTEEDPLSFYEFSGSEFVYDVIYTPEETRMLSRARIAGCRILNGQQMLLEQAYLQYKHFMGIDYPENQKSLASLFF